MQFNTSKNKIDKINKTQNEIDNILKNNKNESIDLKPAPTEIKTGKELFNSEFLPFELRNTFGGGNAENNIMTGFGGITFTGTLNITEDIIKRTQFKIIIKELPEVQIKNIAEFDIFAYQDNGFDTQSGTFQQNVPIKNTSGAIIDNTLSGDGTSSSGDLFVEILSTVVMDIEKLQHQFEDNLTGSQIRWTRITDTQWSFRVNSTTLAFVPSERLDDIVKLSGLREYTATTEIIDEEEVIVFYTVVDNRIEKRFRVYFTPRIDMEAKIIFSTNYNNIWNEYSRFDL